MNVDEAMHEGPSEQADKVEQDAYHMAQGTIDDPSLRNFLYRALVSLMPPENDVGNLLQAGLDGELHE